MFMSFAGGAGIGVSKPEGSGTTGQTFEPTWKGALDDLAPFRRFAGETVVTHFGGEDQDQTTVLPTVSGVCDKKKEHPPVHLCFFVTDTEILINQKRCLACPGGSKGSLKVSVSDRNALVNRTPMIQPASRQTIQRRKEKSLLVERPV